ncbi:MAG: bifunctional riboflavin kinase/FAD synthetase [Candidatus Omnitrophota bacterium]|nr:bifunctional riboflavin kinase/FAD synthetase [Candidatus Omnitrophota bacterium]MBU1929535.1 bifunctional riboflavin kinase/FAD synthetase [Candidatus Omnitrophota bacterium]MBU2035822.1 bifunctional riboflavin kinase/FAD synthetase [Candidatus Omnitrophota bacterium]MBU2221390.1 bifunctional riboflavin kinase/FAD synthetase [Candidatus Omnitrophota bacterium]
MKVIYGINKIIKFRNPVVAMGVFDGVHLGHKRILKEAVTRSKRIKGTSVVLTFDPHPQKENSLYSLQHRIKLFQRIGIDVCIVISFDKRFSGISAEYFIKHILAKRISPRYVYIGENFTFGKNARGDFRLLKKLSSIYGFKLKVVEIIKVDGMPVSSTAIRRLILNGDLDGAAELLSRRVSVLGRVARGDCLATRLGFPTANIIPQHEIIPPSGIYAVKVILKNKSLGGVCYIGTRPTFKKYLNTRGKRVEAHIFNFNKDIYSHDLEIQFIKKIRNDQKFCHPSDLIKVIKKDILKAKNIISPH